MTKALDKQNAARRAKAGDRPYYKLYIETARACPYCDGSLAPRYGIGTYECGCGQWEYRWDVHGKWEYTPIAKDPNGAPTN